MFLSCHVRVLEWIHTLELLKVKELLAQNRRDIWSLSDCNRTQTHNHLVRKWTLKHLTKMACLNVYLRTIWLWVRVPLHAKNGLQKSKRQPRAASSYCIRIECSVFKAISKGHYTIYIINCHFYEKSIRMWHRTFLTKYKLIPCEQVHCVKTALYSELLWSVFSRIRTE